MASVVTSFAHNLWSEHRYHHDFFQGEEATNFAYKLLLKAFITICSHCLRVFRIEKSFFLIISFLILTFEKYLFSPKVLKGRRQMPGTPPPLPIRDNTYQHPSIPWFISTSQTSIRKGCSSLKMPVKLLFV